jgi:hypothetical protein
MQFEDALLNGPEMSQEMSGYRRLWASKLIIHAKDYAAGVRIMGAKGVGKTQGNAGGILDNARRARAWLTSTDDAPATFIWICMVFDLDPDRTRNKILHDWRAFVDKNHEELA